MGISKVFAVTSLLFFVLLYQNCATQNKSKNYRDVRLESEAIIEVSDQNGNVFLDWSFDPQAETLVEIKNRSHSFCTRALVLKSEAEKEWFTVLSKIKTKRDTASSSAPKNMTVKYKNKTVQLSSDESRPFFDLMDKTKRTHDVKITGCEGKKKWSYNKIQVESVYYTENKSKVIQTFNLKIINNEKIEMKLEDQPMNIAKGKDETFCTYTGMTYSPSAKLLTAMFNVEEMNKNDNLSGRSLASSTQNSMMIEIDGRFKFTVDQGSALGQNMIQVMDQMRIAKAAQKTCGFTY